MSLNGSKMNPNPDAESLNSDHHAWSVVLNFPVLSPNSAQVPTTFGKRHLMDTSRWQTTSKFAD